MLTLQFRQPTHPLSINVSKHWAARRRLLEPWKDAAWAHALIAKRKGLWPAPGPVNVQVVLGFRAAARRDPHNYTGTVVKAVMDGLVRAGLIPDDTGEWATVIDPAISIQRDRAEPLMASVVITERTTTP